MASIEVTDSNIQQVLESNGIVILDFWAPWCGPCRAFAPIFEKASQGHADIVFGKVNTEDQRALATAFRIRSIPTLMVFRDRVLVFAQPGMVPSAALEGLIKEIRALDMDAVRAEIQAEGNNQSAVA